MLKCLQAMKKKMARIKKTQDKLEVEVIMNQEEALEFKQQRDAEVEKSRKENREEVFAKGRGDSQSELGKNTTEPS